jgi:hypothetical protein
MNPSQLHLETLFALDAAGRIVSTREPNGSPGPLFTLVRGAESCAWAVRADLPADLAGELSRLAGGEPPTRDLREPPLHAERYASLLGGAVWSGPAFVFPPTLKAPDGVAVLDDEGPLARHFRGWKPGEIRAGRAPMMAVMQKGEAVSCCFSARRSPAAAEAGVETAEGFRGRGLGAQVTTAWALAVRASGRTPMYSTAWSNASSLALARKLGLKAYAADWSVSTETQGSAET